jgi:anion-transporting  ArsA/GET3 family ATPase
VTVALADETAGRMAGLLGAVGDAEVIVCCGSGGVGKTTTAASIGLHLAELGRKVVVVTIDPAKRLADALGLAGGLTNEPQQLTATRNGLGDAAAPAPPEASGDGQGEMWAMMLDTAATFDGLVRANAPSAEQAERILANPFYRNIAGALSGTQEYMAAEKLHSLHNDARFETVIVDTPPTRNALDFLEAPGTLARFLDHPVFRLLMLPTRRGLKVLNIAAQPMLRTVGKVIGGDVLADAIAFFQAFEGMETGFRRRADDVMALLRSDVTRYVLVASPQEDTIEEARYFAARLHEAAVEVSALIVNRSTPSFPVPPGKRAKADAALWQNLSDLNATATSERTHLRALLRDVGAAPTVWVPLLGTDVHDLESLHHISRLLFDPIEDGSALAG